MPDDLNAESLRAAIRGHWGRSLAVLDSTASTMDDASQAARAGAADGHVVVADRQTQGRGAHGRSWASPSGTDLYFSIVLRPEVEPSSMALLTLAAGLGVREAVAALLPEQRITVKWPNDIWIGRRKCAGILVESRVSGTTVEAVIMGVGLNVNRLEWPTELEPIATSLRAARGGGARFDRKEVLISVLAHMERWVQRLLEDGARSVVSELRPNLALVGERIRWEQGRGIFEGIDITGAARVQTDIGMTTLHTAHIEPQSD